MLALNSVETIYLVDESEVGSEAHCGLNELVDSIMHRPSSIVPDVVSNSFRIPVICIDARKSFLSRDFFIHSAAMQKRVVVESSG